jgi:hypothetical protein
MESVKYKVTWKTYLLPALGLVAFFLYIYLFKVDILEIIAEVRRINLSFYVLAAIATLLDTLFFALAWHSLLTFLSVKLSRLKAYLFVWVGFFIDTLIPAESVSGEVSKIYYVNKEQSGTAGKATASLVAQRLIGMSINIATLLGGAALLFIGSQLNGLILTLIFFLVAVTFLFLVLTLLLCVKENWTMRIVDMVIRFADWISRRRWKLSKLREEVVEATKAFHIAIKDYAHAPRTLLFATSLSIVSWIFTLSVFYLTFLSIGYPQVSWGAILVVSAIFVAVKSIPVGVPFEVGLPEITLTTLFLLFGVPPDKSATATILMRLLTLWMRFFIGFASQQWLGMKVIAATVSSKTGGDHD